MRNRDPTIINIVICQGLVQVAGHSKKRAKKSKSIMRGYNIHNDQQQTFETMLGIRWGKELLMIKKTRRVLETEANHKYLQEKNSAHT